MTEQTSNTVKKRGWKRFVPIAVPFVIGGVAAAVFLGGFTSFVQYTNTMEFCISCHEMRDTVYVEYQDSSHYKTRSGIRPTCADCHVPQGNWIATLAHKTMATKELFLHIGGVIDTPEKFEAARLELAENVWAGMKANDSANCRNCHKNGAWDLALHRPRARNQHEDALTTGETCIDCHKGIAHKLPQQDEPPVEEELEDPFALE